MRNHLMLILIAASAFTLFQSCEKDDIDTIPDPIGTYTVSLDPNGVLIYEDYAEDGSWTPPNGYTFDKIRLYMFLNVSNLNASFRTDAGRIDGFYWGPGVGFQSGEISGIGLVNGLGNIDFKPISGYSTAGLLEKGHGYVIRSKKYLVDDPNAPYTYYRFYVEDWIVNIYGGINAAKIKIQGPY